MKRFWSQPLRRQLLIAVLLLLFPVIVAGAWSGVSTYRERLQELGDQARVVALTTGAAINRELTGYDRMARNVSTNAVLLDFAAANVIQMMRPQLVQRPSLIEMVIGRSDGTVVARVPGVSRISIDLVALASEVSRAKQRTMSGMQESSSGLHYVTLTYPIADDSGNIVGLLVCVVNPQRMPDLFGVLPMPRPTPRRRC